MSHIETEELTIAQLLLALDSHMAEAEMHLLTAQTLIDEATERGLDVGPGAVDGEWVQLKCFSSEVRLLMDSRPSTLTVPPPVR